ncbi:unnamed protein product [Protopolystoma xenopodis]|uniref:Uncharacterized protein n=1 Tax=Protopolystoma xenopodis TaxID=117903 RepID=A0A448WZC9_9PLAT|nr:unnamed protein product [Protopolystoma xenopodis]
MPVLPSRRPASAELAFFPLASAQPLIHSPTCPLVHSSTHAFTGSCPVRSRQTGCSRNFLRVLDLPLHAEVPSSSRLVMGPPSRLTLSPSDLGRLKRLCLTVCLLVCGHGASAVGLPGKMTLPPAPGLDESPESRESGLGGESGRRAGERVHCPQSGPMVRTAVGAYCGLRREVAFSDSPASEVHVFYGKPNRPRP